MAEHSAPGGRAEATTNAIKVHDRHDEFWRIQRGGGDSNGKQDSTESDSVHPRLRPRETPKTYLCLSCHTSFKISAERAVSDHYGLVEHKNFFSDCLYCGGKVHQYCEEDAADSANQPRLIYHNCLRWKRGDDK